MSADLDPRRRRERGSAHAPRPTDLVALVTFDGEVYENQAVTRDRLARPATAPRPLNAAIERWLGRGRQTWIDVRGRQINGIATAREHFSSQAWMIDTLVDAAGAGETGVVAALLRQAMEAATAEGVAHLLLRVAAGAPALPDALRAGFKPALSERLWCGELLLRSQAPAQATAGGPPPVREACDADAFALFQLYNRSLPIDGRQALALSLEEWQDVQERRWLRRDGREYVALADNRICAALRLTRCGDVGQFDLLADAEGVAGATALLAVAAEQLAGAEHVLALVPRCAAALEQPLRERGLEAETEYALLCRRTAQPLAKRAWAAAGLAVRGDV